MTKSRVKLIVKGRVQGVCYRYYSVDRAQALELKGYVKNRRNGSVEIVAEGDAVNLRKFIDWARMGSPASDVNDIEVTWEEYKGEFQKFSVKF